MPKVWIPVKFPTNIKFRGAQQIGKVISNALFQFPESFDFDSMFHAFPFTCVHTDKKKFSLDISGFRTVGFPVPAWSQWLSNILQPKF